MEHPLQHEGSCYHTRYPHRCLLFSPCDPGKQPRTDKQGPGAIILLARIDFRRMWRLREAWLVFCCAALQAVHVAYAGKEIIIAVYAVPVLCVLGNLLLPERLLILCAHSRLLFLLHPVCVSLWILHTCCTPAAHAEFTNNPCDSNYIMYMVYSYSQKNCAVVILGFKKSCILYLVCLSMELKHFCISQIMCRGFPAWG